MIVQSIFTNFWFADSSSLDQPYPLNTIKIDASPENPIYAVAIGANSETDCVYLRSLGDESKNQPPLRVSVERPFLGTLTAPHEIIPAYLYSRGGTLLPTLISWSPIKRAQRICYNAGSAVGTEPTRGLYHRMELDVYRDSPPYFLPDKRAPYVQAGTKRFAAAPSANQFVAAFPLFGRRYAEIYSEIDTTGVTVTFTGVGLNLQSVPWIPDNATDLLADTSAEQGGLYFPYTTWTGSASLFSTKSDDGEGPVSFNLSGRQFWDWPPMILLLFCSFSSGTNLDISFTMRAYD